MSSVVLERRNRSVSVGRNTRSFCRKMRCHGKLRPSDRSARSVAALIPRAPNGYGAASIRGNGNRRHGGRKQSGPRGWSGTQRVSHQRGHQSARGGTPRPSRGPRVRTRGAACRWEMSSTSPGPRALRRRIRPARSRRQAGCSRMQPPSSAEPCGRCGGGCIRIPHATNPRGVLRTPEGGDAVLTDIIGLTPFSAA